MATTVQGGIGPRADNFAGRPIASEREYLIDCFTKAVDDAIKHGAWFFRADYKWLTEADIPATPKPDGAR